MRIRIPALTLALCLTCVQAHAMPGEQSGMQSGNDQQLMETAVQTFKKTDSNNDGFLSREEFRKAFPGMKDAAFDSIDTDHDGRISRQEWQQFAIGHSMGRSGQGSGMPDDARTGGLPRVTPPDGAGLPAVSR